MILSIIWTKKDCIEEFTVTHTEQKEGIEMAQANKKVILSHVRHTIFAVNIFSLLINTSSVPSQGFTSSHKWVTKTGL